MFLSSIKKIIRALKNPDQEKNKKMFAEIQFFISFPGINITFKG